MYQPQTGLELNIIKPDDPAFEYWNSRSANLRLKGNPSRIIPVSSIEELTKALQETVNENSHLAIRGGGHCLENFVSDNLRVLLRHILRKPIVRNHGTKNTVIV